MSLSSTASPNTSYTTYNSNNLPPAPSQSNALSSSSNNTSANIGLGIGVGVASYSSSSTPFSLSSSPPSALLSSSSPTNHHHHIQPTHLNPRHTSTIPNCSLNQPLGSTYTTNTRSAFIHQQQQQQTFTASSSSHSSSLLNPATFTSTPVAYDSSFIASPSSSSLSSSLTATSPSSSPSNQLFSSAAAAAHSLNNSSPNQAQTGQQALTVTLITAIPPAAATSAHQNSTIATLTTTTPLIPISVQQQQQNQQQIAPAQTLTSLTAPQSGHTSVNYGSSLQQPSTSAVSSSSAAITPAQNLSSTTRDWFTFVYKIENIEELIKNHESQQNFVQSPVFSFTNHIISASPTPPATPASNVAQAAPSSPPFSGMSSQTMFGVQQVLNSSPLPVNSVNSQPTVLSSLNNNNNNSSSSSSSTSGNATAAKQPSNWRLIFYPNGAGADCKNFLSIFLKYLSDEPVKIQMMFSIVDNNNEDVYVKYTVNKFNKANDWGFKQLIHKNAILFQKEKFLKAANGGTLSVRVKMRLDEHKHDYIKKLNDNLHYCKLLSENFSQYYYNNSNSSANTSNETNNEAKASLTPVVSQSIVSQAWPAASPPMLTLPASPTSLNTPSSSCSPSSIPKSASLTSLSSSSSTTSPSLNSSHTACSLANNTSSNSSYYDVLLLVRANTATIHPFHDSFNQFKNLCKTCLNELYDESVEEERLAHESSLPSLEPLKQAEKRSYFSMMNDNEEEEDEEFYQSSSKRLKLGVNEDQSAIAIGSIRMKCYRCSCLYYNENESEFMQFRAHKCILAARSPVFKAMFNYKLKENSTNKIIIDDCKPEVVKAMLKYIYTAYLPDDINSIAIDLYKAAEKYSIESLKIKCREFIVENLSIKNVINVYLLAELHSDSMIRKQCIKIMHDNANTIVKTQEWLDFVQRFPEIFSTAFIRVCSKDY